jgi:hypothetical protein
VIFPFAGHNETRHPMETVDDIYSWADILKTTAALYFKR